MKIDLSVLCLLLIVVSCFHIQPEDSLSNSISPIMADIGEQAKCFRGKFFNETKAESIIVERIQYIIENGDTLAINVDFKHNKGFVLFTVDNLPLCIMSKGSFDKSLLEIPAFRLTYESVLAELKKNRVGPPEPIDTTLSIVNNLIYEGVTSEVSPLIEVNMHQYYPFSFFAPNGYAGCTPVAIAQAFSVFDYPSAIDITFEGSAVDSVSLSWTNMEQHLSYHNDSSCVYCLENGYLLREIGHRCYANYTVTGTGAMPSESCFNSFNYMVTVAFAFNNNPFNADDIISSLNSGFPTVISGLSDTSGHSWNIDGYYNYVSCYSVDTMMGSIVLLHNWNEIIHQLYLHFNYGWGGDSNGYVLSRVIRRKIFDDGSYSESTPLSIFSAPYNDIRRWVTNIRPAVL